MRIVRFIVGVLAVVAAALPVSAAEASVTAYTDTVGTAWWTDPVSGMPVVSVDDSVPAARADTLRRVVTSVGGRYLREPGALAQHIAGGDPFGTGFNRCLVGFNARSGSTYYFMTSAHCVPATGMNVYATDGSVLGVVHGTLPGYDLALVRHTNALPKPSAVNVPGVGLRPITSFGSGAVGQTVTRVGSSGVRSGTITAINVTVNYPTGTVTGLIRTNICSTASDSGGPLFANTVGIGVTSGGSGSCTSGGTSYYASARRAATTWGVSTY